MLIRRRLFERWCGLWMMIWIHHRGVSGAHYILQRICSATIRVQVMCARINGFLLPKMQCNSVDLAFYQDFVFNFYFNVDYSDAPPRLLSFQLISRARVLPTPIYGVHMSPSSVIGIRSNSDPFLSFFTLSLLYFLIFPYSSSRNADMHSVLHTDSP